MLEDRIDDGEFRRLPVYLLLDTSGSMHGAAIQAVNEGLQVLDRVLRDDPQSYETAHISIITFGGTAQQIVSMQPVDAFKPPVLIADGGTPLGAALELLDEAIDREVRLRTEDQQADWKPIVFIMTDGQPTDPPAVWAAAVAKIRERANRRVANFIALGAGPGADLGMLKELGCTAVLAMADATPDAMGEFFSWVSQSIQVVSRSASTGADGDENPLPSLPSGINIVL